MKKRAIAALVAAAAGGLLGGATAGLGNGPAQQCYYRPLLDPPTACTGCADTCMGEGYRCCSITVLEP